jgi:hypothetical protein
MEQKQHLEYADIGKALFRNVVKLKQVKLALKTLNVV